MRMARKKNKYDPVLTLAKKDALKIARDLCYPAEVRLRIEDAESVAEVTRILTDARKNS